MWRRRATIRRLFSTVRGRIIDEGDWSYVPEWWGQDYLDTGDHTVFRSASEFGNGEVSVVSYPSSEPAPEKWPAVEKELEQRYAKLHPESKQNERFKILGYQWRVLRFNDNTRQSTTKVMSAYRKGSASFYLVPQPHCLAVPYVKSMVSAGLAGLSTSSFDLLGAVTGKRSMNVLCIGHGGGSLPLFLASKIKGAVVHSVEIDPVVIQASVHAMGFPLTAVTDESLLQLPSPQPPDSDDLFWQDIRHRLFLHKSDAEDFILNSQETYDMIFVDAYDGDDIFPHKLWDPHGPFLKSLKTRTHPDHGTVVVNLHSDSDVLSGSIFDAVLPMGKYVSQVCRAYKESIGFAFKVSVPWLCNITLVARTSGVGLGRASRDLYRNELLAEADTVERLLDLPYPCLEYVKRGLVLID